MKNGTNGHGRPHLTGNTNNYLRVMVPRDRESRARMYEAGLFFFDDTDPDDSRDAFVEAFRVAQAQDGHVAVFSLPALPMIPPGLRAIADSTMGIISGCPKHEHRFPVAYEEKGKRRTVEPGCARCGISREHGRGKILPAPASEVAA